MSRRRTLKAAVVLTIGTALAAATFGSFAEGAPSSDKSPKPSWDPTPKPTVVLVNGAWSDAASWSGVIKRLRADGYPVVAPPTGLRSLSDDSAYLASFLKTIQGPVVLAGQSYGGSVITNAATGNSSVKALVYISAFAPDAGESAADLTAKFPGTHITTDPAAQVPTALTPVPYTLANGSTGIDLYAKAAQYSDVFLSNRVSSETAATLAATQSPIATTGLFEASGPPAWKSVPSWFLISKDDHLIPPATQRFMAARAGGHTVEADTPHAAQVTDPGVVTTLIERAASSR
ncbi:alpha/beta hydrolase [Kribbella lupini]|uniref:Alpha/beta hydrolase n=1 Tax=Kribbella lupini TaxID=291602 RepID=A0ABN2C2C8_9ACTN